MSRPPIWQHVITDAGHHLRLIGANGEPILTSEVYSDGEQVEYAIALVKRGVDTFRIKNPVIVDERTGR